MKQLTLIMKLVSLSSTYSSTITDWNTLKNTDRTDKPSSDFRLFQNWISFLNASSSNTLCRIVTTTVIPSRYGFVSSSASFNES
uniref:Putative secreted peptide n=1 Tax=Anopheles braziliensis TaxID=58242 RepID=A0A2M3ZR06_9DIPT